VAAEKKANKQERIKKELMALPSMSRIKIRVSAGVFEVSLVKVVEDSGSVEVLWDRGLKKEFKWGSVVFGSTDGPVHQKPSEPAPEPLMGMVILFIMKYHRIETYQSSTDHGTRFASVRATTVSDKSTPTFGVIVISADDK